MSDNHLDRKLLGLAVWLSIAALCTGEEALEVPVSYDGRITVAAYDVDQEQMASKTLRPALCQLCQFAVAGVLLVSHGHDRTYRTLPDVLKRFCPFVPSVGGPVCTVMIDEMAEEALYLLKKLDLGHEEVCGIMLPAACPVYRSAWRKRWTLKMPRRPAHLPWQSVAAQRRKMSVLHISDIHIDLKYEEDTEADCNAPLCCRGKSGGRRFVRNPAGRWGTAGKCDVPYRTFEHLLAHVASTHALDYVMWTGDLPAHDDWEQSRLGQLSLLRNLTRTLLRYFPGTPVYSSLGNHEGAPVNSFPPRYVNATEVGGAGDMSWLYGALADLWRPWLPPEALATVRRYGYYTLLHRPGFRIISLNTNVCNFWNFWTLLDPVDPDRQLRWLVDVLVGAELSGERVHILGHIPPSSGESGHCFPVWRSNYYRIVERFASVITGQFFGHTHTDELNLIYGGSGGGEAPPLGVVYVAPSVTTYVGLHPGYRLYDVEVGTWQVHNHYTYVMNLTKANELASSAAAAAATGDADALPQWQLLYDAKSAYGLSSLKPREWHRLVAGWKKSGGGDTVETTFERYYSNFYKGFPLQKACDASCRRSMLCKIAAGNFTNVEC